MAAAEELARVVGTAPACEALTVNRASLYRRRKRPASTSRCRPAPSRALSEAERETVRDLLHAPRFVDKAPAQVWAFTEREAGAVRIINRDEAGARGL